MDNEKSFLLEAFGNVWPQFALFKDKRSNFISNSSMIGSSNTKNVHSEGYLKSAAALGQ